MPGRITGDPSPPEQNPWDLTTTSSTSPTVTIVDDDKSESVMLPITPTSCDNKSMSSTQAQVPSSRRGDWSNICANQKAIKSRCTHKPTDIIVPTCSVPAATVYADRSSYGALDLGSPESSPGVQGFFVDETSPELQRKLSFIEWKTHGTKSGRCGAPSSPKCTGLMLFATVIITVFATIYLGYLLNSDVEMNHLSQPHVQSEAPRSEPPATDESPTPHPESAARLQREAALRQAAGQTTRPNSGNSPQESPTCGDLPPKPTTTSESPAEPAKEEAVAGAR